MGLIHWVRAGIEMRAKRAFLDSMGYYRDDDGFWVSDSGRTRIHERDLRRWTLTELKRHYSQYTF